MNKAIIIAAVVLLLVIGAIFFLGGMEVEDEVIVPEDESETEEEDVIDVEIEMEDEEVEMESPEEAVEGEVREFEIDGVSGFSFSAEELVVNEGDTVRVTLRNVDNMPHDFVVDGLGNPRTEVIEGGEESTVEFVADTAGTYEYYCSVGQHRAQGMVGTLIVQ